MSVKMPRIEHATLLPEERRREIAALVQEKGGASIGEMQERFGVSAMTLRRDLEALEHRGSVKRSHGGAVPPTFAAHEDSFQHRLSEVPLLKQQIARAAAKQLQAGETIFLDSSTTTYYLAREIERLRLPLTVLTNSLPVLELLGATATSNFELIAIGGTMRWIPRHFVGPQAVHAASAYYADKAFVSAIGLTPDGIVTDPEELEAEIKRVMITHSAKPTLLIDGRKFAHRGLSAIVHLSQFAQVIVADAPAESLQLLRGFDIEVVRADIADLNDWHGEEGG